MSASSNRGAAMHPQKSWGAFDVCFFFLLLVAGTRLMGGSCCLESLVRMDALDGNVEMNEMFRRRV